MMLPQYAELFERFAASLPQGERAAREKHLNQFLKLGFPTKRLEDWRYTDLSALAAMNFNIAPANGSFIGANEPAANDSLAALNHAFASGGLSLNLADKEITAEPICIRSHGESGMTHQRHHIHLGRQSKVTIVFDHSGAGDYFTTQFCNIFLSPASHLTIYRVQDESPRSYHLAQTNVQLARDARLDVVTVDLGAGLARHDLNISLDGRGAQAHVHGLYAPTGGHVDNHTRIEHRAPHCVSREFFRGIVGANTKAVFNGKVVVHEGAIKTDSEQRVANLLLSPKAEVNAKPELEIYNDDVKCAHGATFGQLDDDALFYLRARGIPAETARSLLVFAFAQDVLHKIGLADLRESITARLQKILSGSQP